MDMHSLPVEKLFEVFKSSEDGLTRFNYDSNLRKYGKNELIKCEKIKPWQIFLAQFHNILIYILIGAALISIFAGELLDALVILAIIIINAILGFFQEYKAERSMEALQKLSSLKAKVIRNAREYLVPVEDVVPGDVILLETGDKIPADARLLESMHFETQESSLTGESMPLKKEPGMLDEDIILAERKNMVYCGTIVTRGHAKALVVATGMDTELGKIATMVLCQERKLTPLQRKIEEFGTKLGYGIIAISLLVFIIGVFRYGFTIDLFLIAVALAVAAIPEGLPIVVTISLALGTKKMLAKNALMRRLSSVEALGSVTVICSDKTGTFTKNEMTVRKLYVNNTFVEVTGTGYKASGGFLVDGKPVNPKHLSLLLKIGALNNNSALSRETVIGDPTEACLLVSAKKAGFDVDKLKRENPRIDEIEFSSERKCMTTVHKIGKSRVVFVKGAPDVIMEKCNRILVNGKIEQLKFSDKAELLEKNNQLASEALRILAFAYKEYDHPTNYEKNLIFVGLQGIIDPPRDEVKQAIVDCKSAGIRVVMITGDNENTAKAIAAHIGIEGRCMTGKELDKLLSKSDLTEFDKQVEEISIYARVNPSHKMQIVDALQRKHYHVAMTGDGVNDAPALKKSDIGIAMGITGTDVCKESADMVLLDDNFASIVHAVEEGRGVYNNIRKFLAFLFSGNIGIVIFIILSFIIGLPLPLVAIQILLINLVTDGPPATALSADLFEPNLMKRSPRTSTHSLYHGLYSYLITVPLIMAIISLLLFGIAINYVELVQAQTMVFLFIVLFKLFLAFSSRSTIYPVFEVGVFRNIWLNIAVASSFVVIVLVTYVPALNVLFKTSPLAWYQFLMILVLSSSGAVYLELYKYYTTRKEKNASDISNNIPNNLSN